MDNIFEDMLNELNEARDQDKDIKQQREIKEAVQRYREKHKRKKPLFEAQAPQMFYEMMEESPAPEPAPEPSYFREPEPELVVEEVRDTRSNIEKASEWISYSNKEEVKTDPQSIREGYDITERVRLLEQDLFRVQSQAKPQTLVAGIGASLDSGGGAVWLWDLEDVNIGVPVNGQYPSISDGQALIYDLATNKWIPGAGGGGGTFDGDITATFLEFDGAQATQAIRVSGATGKAFDIEVGETKETASIVAKFSPGKLTLPSGELAADQVTATNAHFSGQLVTNEENVTTLLGARQGVVYKLVAGTGLTFEGQLSTHIGGTVGNEYNTNVGTIGVGATVLQTTGSQIITGDKTYTGSTDDARSLQTKKSVTDLIAAGGGGLDFNFMGTTDVTTANPPVGSEVPGNYFSNTTAGTAGAGWTGIAGESIAQHQLLIYTALTEAEGGPWASGAETDLTVYVPLAGTTSSAPITGNLVSSANIDAAAITGTGLVKGQSIQASDANYISTFAGKLSVEKAIVLNGGIDRILKPADSIGSASMDIGFSNNKFKDIYVTGVKSSTGDFTGNVTVDGNVTLGNGSSDTISANGYFITNLNPGATNTYNLGAQSFRWDQLYVHQINCSGTSEFGGAANFKGNVTLGDQQADTVTINSLINGNLLPYDQSSNTLGSDTFKWHELYVSGTSKLTGSVTLGTSNTDSLIVHSTPTFYENTTFLKNTTFGSDANNITTIHGVINGSLVPQSGSHHIGSDSKIWTKIHVSEISTDTTYIGSTSGGTNLQTKTSIQTNYMPPVAWTSLNQGAFESAGASTLTGHGTVCHYRVNPYTEMVDFNFYFQMDSAGNGFQQNQKIGFLPTAARPLSLKLTVPCVATDSGGNNQAYGFLELYSDGGIFIRELTGTSVALYKLFAEAQWYGGSTWT